MKFFIVLLSVVNLTFCALRSDSLYLSKGARITDDVQTKYNRLVKDPTGFVDRSESQITYNQGTRQITISPTGPSFGYYQVGKYYNVSSQATTTISNTVGTHYIFYATNGQLTSSTTPWSFVDTTVFVATAYYNGSQMMVGDERHGCNMDAATHEYLHNTIGSRYFSGLTGTFSNTTFSITSGYIYDEDIKHTIQDQTQGLVLYRSGGNWVWQGPQSLYYYTSGGNIYYDNDGTITASAQNSYVAYFVFATNNVTTPIVFVAGQRTDVLLESAITNNTYSSLSLSGLPFKEYRHIYTVILRNDATPYEQAIDHRLDVNLGLSTTNTDHTLLTNLNSVNYYHLTQTNHTDLTDNGESSLHYHSSDRSRSNHTGTQLSSTISDFATAVSGVVSGVYATIANVFGSLTSGRIPYFNGTNYVNSPLSTNGTAVTATDSIYSPALRSLRLYSPVADIDSMVGDVRIGGSLKTYGAISNVFTGTDDIFYLLSGSSKLFRINYVAGTTYNMSLNTLNSNSALCLNPNSKGFVGVWDSLPEYALDVGGTIRSDSGIIATTGNFSDSVYSPALRSLRLYSPVADIDSMVGDVKVGGRFKTKKTPSTLDSYNTTVDTSYNKTSEPNRIVILGSSVAAGSGASTYDSSWAGRLTTAMPGWEIINRSIGGNSAQSILDRFYRDCAVYNPSYVIIAVSIWNGGLFASNPDSGFINYVHIMDRLERECCDIGAKMIVAGTYPCISASQTTAQYIRKFYEYSKARGYQTIDFLAPLDDGTGKILPSLDVGDGVHPNDAGHRAMFESINRTMFLPVNSRNEALSTKIAWTNQNPSTQVGPITVKTTTPMHSYSAFAWVRNNSQNYGIAVIAFNNNNLLRIRTPFTVFSASPSGSTDDLMSSTSSIDGMWHHIGITYNNSTTKTILYVDGLATDSTTDIAQSATDIVTFLGRPDASWANCSGWDIADPVVYRTALKFEDVKNLFNGVFAQKSAEAIFLMGDYPTIGYQSNHAVSHSTIYASELFSANKRGDQIGEFDSLHSHNIYVVGTIRSDSGIIARTGEFSSTVSSTGGFIGNITGNLTGTASAATNSDQLDGYHASSFSQVGHSHEISAVNNLQTTLNTKIENNTSVNLHSINGSSGYDSIKNYEYLNVNKIVGGGSTDSIYYFGYANINNVKCDTLVINNGTKIYRYTEETYPCSLYQGLTLLTTGNAKVTRINSTMQITLPQLSSTVSSASTLTLKGIPASYFSNSTTQYLPAIVDNSGFKNILVQCSYNTTPYIYLYSGIFTDGSLTIRMITITYAM